MKSKDLLLLPAIVSQKKASLSAFFLQ